MILNMGMQECDSFEEEDIDNLEAELGLVEGPDLGYFSLQDSSAIEHFVSKEVIQQIVSVEGRDLKLIGNDEDSQFQAFFYILLLLGVEQQKKYPHLNTLIKEQFYKPNIFRNREQACRQRETQSALLEKSLKYFEKIGEGVRVDDYMVEQPLFELAGIAMLKNSIQNSKIGIYEQFANKFNIDIKIIKEETHTSCYQFGKFFIIREANYFFAALTDNKQENMFSKLDAESIRSAQEGNFLHEPSENSTPKFKNSEANRFAKKSHKNSFGGDLQNFQYRQLVQMHAQKYKNSNLKVFSEYMEPHEIDSCNENLLDSNHANQKQKEEEKQGGNIVKAEMKGSTTIHPQHMSKDTDRRKDRKIAASQIIQHQDYLFGKLTRHDSVPQVPIQPQRQIEEKSKSYQSLVVGKKVSLQQGRMKGSLIHNRSLQRIDELQSSQKESTHPDQQSEKSNQNIIESITPEVFQDKLKDRKYSYFTQQVASNSKKKKQIESSNYVFKLPKAHHKNSEVIVPTRLESQYIKRRFQQNPLRFSQLGSPSEQSFPANTTTIHKSKKDNIKINRCIYSYFISSQPEGWYRKEITYHLPQSRTQTHVFQRQRYIHSPTNATPLSQAFNNTRSRTSFGSSSNSQPSKLPSLENYKSKEQLEIHHYHPHQLSQQSFLKNKSFSNLVVPGNEHVQSTNSILISSKSLQQIRHNAGNQGPKIRFSYDSRPTSICFERNDQALFELKSTNDRQKRPINYRQKRHENYRHKGSYKLYGGLSRQVGK